MNTIEIGKFIKSKRIEKHLTQKDLANKLKISFQAVSKWETGTTLPDTSLLIDLSDILQVTVDQILNAGEFRKPMNQKIDIAELKEALQSILKLKTVLGPNNGFYRNMINSIKDENGNNIEDFLKDEQQSELVLAKSVIQLIVDGYTVDVKELRTYFTIECLIEKIKKYQIKYNSN